MIEAKDLRIGNWVLDQDNIPCKISVLYSEQKNKFEGWDVLKRCYEIELPNLDSIYLSDTIEPISLTKDILEKCGFEKDTHPPQDIWSNDFMIIFFNEAFGFYTGYWKNNFVIKYIHQLQNLYHALTNKELEINLS